MDAADFLEIFGTGSESDDPVVVNLTEPEYNFENYDFSINSPCVINSEVSSVFRCKRLLIQKCAVQIKGIKFESSIVLRNSNNTVITDCEFSNGSMEYGGFIVLTNSQDCKIYNSTFHDSLCAGIFLEFNSKATIDNVRMWNVKDQNLTLSFQCAAEVSNCEFKESNSTAITCQVHSTISLTNTKIDGIHALGLNFADSCVYLADCIIQNIDQNGINVHQCKKIDMHKNFFKNTGSSSISLINQDVEADISENTFEEIHGNVIIQNDGSRSSIHHNKISKVDYPAFAILTNSSAKVTNNEISDCSKAGICARSAVDVIIQDNTIDKVQDTGLSISDSQNIMVAHNVISNCKVAGVESYNSSTVTCKDNTFENPGKYGFMIYAGARLDAANNKIINPTEALALLTTRGSGEITDNTVENCPAQSSGQTSGQFYLKGNGSFDSVTNIPEKVSADVKLAPPFEDTGRGKCFKCGVNNREGFFSPCGHLMYCRHCGEEAVKNKEICPLCRFPIQAFACPHEQNLVEGVCTICLTNQSDAVVLPCGHTGYCYSCLSEWISRNGTCPVCRIEATCKKIHDL